MPWWHPTAEKVMCVSGVVAFLVTLHWVRSRDLREKYAMLWLLVASAILLLGVFPGILMKFAEWTRFSYPAAVLFVVVAAVYALAFAVTVSQTSQYRRSIRLGQELAILEARLHRVEEALRKAQAAAPPTKP